MGLTLLAAEKRKAARMALELPVVIRFQDGQDEVVETQNVSTDGLCFISERFIKEGDCVQLGMDNATNDGQRVVLVHVIWRVPLRGTNKGRYGVRFGGGSHSSHSA